MVTHTPIRHAANFQLTIRPLSLTSRVWDLTERPLRHTILVYEMGAVSDCSSNEMSTVTDGACVVHATHWSLWHILP